MIVLVRFNLKSAFKHPVQLTQFKLEIDKIPWGSEQDLSHFFRKLLQG